MRRREKGERREKQERRGESETAVRPLGRRM